MVELFKHILHLDFDWLFANFGTAIYVVLFLVIFIETGLVAMPFLPGDSLLFAAGALAANPSNNLNVGIIIVSLIIAALLGDNTNYFMGRYLAKKGAGAKLFGVFTIRKDYLDKTHFFYEKNGPRTIILARFIPIVRTFAPFVAGVGSMTYKRYIMYCIVGAILWVTMLTLTGYAFGNIPWIKNNFELVVFGIIGISLLPILFEIIKNKLKK